jgi:hypothetical protein
MSDVIPHIGPLPPARQRFDRVRDVGRKHMPWITAVVLLGSIASLTFSETYFLGLPLGGMGIALLVLALLVNVLLVVSDRIWKPIEVLGTRGLTMIDDWLDEKEEWIEPIAQWIHACGDLDSRHFMCLRRILEGPRAAPLEAVTGQWVLFMRSRRKSMCSSPMDLGSGRMIEAVEKVRIDKLNEQLKSITYPAPSPPRPRPRL